MHLEEVSIFAENFGSTTGHWTEVQGNDHTRRNCDGSRSLTSFHRQYVAACREDRGNQEISLRWQDSSEHARIGSWPHDLCEASASCRPAMFVSSPAARLHHSYRLRPSWMLRAERAAWKNASGRPQGRLKGDMVVGFAPKALFIEWLRCCRRCPRSPIVGRSMWEEAYLSASSAPLSGGT
jgi:hypothetical protein